MTPPNERPSFLQRRPVRRALANWRERHRDPWNFALHLLGIPLVFIVAPLFAIDAFWVEAIFAIVVGYLLQWIGHLIEGNDLGEWAGVKRLLGWPYVGISPRWQNAENEASAGCQPPDS